MTEREGPYYEAWLTNFKADLDEKMARLRDMQSAANDDT